MGGRKGRFIWGFVDYEENCGKIFFVWRIDYKVKVEVGRLGRTVLRL